MSKLLGLLLIGLLLASSFGLGRYSISPPPPAPVPPTVNVYGAIIAGEPGSLIGITEAVGALGYASNIHQWYLDNPWAMNRYTGGEWWHTNWVNAYGDINQLIMQLAKEAGRVP